MHKKIGNQSALKRAFESVRDLTGIQPDEFTRSDFIEFSKEQGVKFGRDTAMRKLNELIKAGVLEARETIHNSSRIKVYREKK